MRLPVLAALCCLPQLLLFSPPGLAIDAARGIHQLQHTSWTARDGAPDDISVIAQGGDGFLLLGWQAGGISHVKDGVVRNYGAAQGVLPGSIWGFAIDATGAVLPAFYQTWWFRGLCAAALLAAAYGVCRWRTREHAARLQARMQAQQAERERIARELHDTLLQGTQALILHFHNASMAIAEGDPARAAMLRALDDADRMLGEGRDHVHDLRAGDDVGARWSAILQREGERLAAQHGIVFRYAEEGEARMLHARAAHEIYRIASEALRNAFQHARAQVVEVAVRYARGGIELAVRDDGQGLPPVVAANGQIPGHWGMPGMRERAARLGARLSVDGRDGGGTQWRLRVPARRAWPVAHGPLRRWWQRWRRSGVEDAAP